VNHLRRHGDLLLAVMLALLAVGLMGGLV